jgi:hypothetical protein
MQTWVPLNTRLLYLLSVAVRYYNRLAALQRAARLLVVLIRLLKWIAISSAVITLIGIYCRNIRVSRFGADMETEELGI